jgi:hypothetical protein
LLSVCGIASLSVADASLRRSSYMEDKHVS